MYDGVLSSVDRAFGVPLPVERVQLSDVLVDELRSKFERRSSRPLPSAGFLTMASMDWGLQRSAGKLTHPIRVLIVDDSAVARQALSTLLSRQDGIEVAGCAADAFQAARLLRCEIPSVVVLDVEMPHVDGMRFLRRLMRLHPVPTIVCSSFADESSATAMAALEAGAVDLIQKPIPATPEFFETEGARIVDGVRAAADARVRAWPMLLQTRALAPFRSGRRTQPSSPELLALPTTTKVVAVGASIGGTEAIRILLQRVRVTLPGIAIVQHMPSGFTAPFARRLAQVCRLNVREGNDGDPLLPGHVLVAPCDRHMVVRRDANRFFVEMLHQAPVNCRRPSVDVLFDSVTECAGADAVGVLLTGLGVDGAQGLLRMRRAGAYTLAQDQDSCVVYGMPREAARLGAPLAQLPLDELSEALAHACSQTSSFCPPRSA